MIKKSLKKSADERHQFIRGMLHGLDLMESEFKKEKALKKPEIPILEDYSNIPHEDFWLKFPFNPLPTKNKPNTPLLVDEFENEILTDTTTIFTGLGKLTLNGCEKTHVSTNNNEDGSKTETTKTKIIAT